MAWGSAARVLLLSGWAVRCLGCLSSLDCSLNGACVDATCQCEPAWTGAQCEVLNQLPAPPAAEIKLPGVSTWGGGPLQRSVAGEFHLWASEIAGNCGITTWMTNSLVSHFTAPAPTGPWRRRDQALPVWSHCPSAALTPNGAVVMWAFHGSRAPRSGPDAWGNRCQAGASPCGFAKHGCGPDAPPPPRIHQQLRARSAELPVWVAAGPGGGWKQQILPIEEPVTYSIAAPWVLDNGTAFWVLQAECPADFCPGGACQGTCGTVIRGETWEGPYRVVARGACSLGEDHSMYVDGSGGFHCLTHRFSNASLPAGPFDAARNGGHAFSPDGRDPWFCVDGNGGHGRCTLDSPIAYNSTVVYQESGVNRFGTRERPHMLFDKGKPVALITSVQHCQPPQVPDACTADPRSCNQSNLLCHNNWPGYMDRSWTSIVPLGTR